MPFYDFKCTACGNVEELMLSRDKIDSEHRCSACKGVMKRLLSCPEFKMDKAPPKGYKPLAKSNPKSHIEPIRRKSNS